jgi:hypothetical protein
VCVSEYVVIAVPNPVQNLIPLHLCASQSCVSVNVYAKVCIIICNLHTLVNMFTSVCKRVCQS